MLSTPLKWHGGKHYLASKIIALMPRHLHYVEPYFGGGSVLLHKDPEGISEVVNDINQDLTNFWRTLQFPGLFDEFYQRIQVTPFSEREWSDALCCQGCSTVARAVKFFIRCRQSLAGRMDGFSSITKTRTRRGMNGEVAAWLSCIESLPEIHDRLRRILILDRPALSVIKTQDSKDTLFYLDPPYPKETRTARDVYQYEMSKEAHIRLLDLIVECRGKVIISSYPNELYEHKLRRWNSSKFDLPNNSAGGANKRRMTEMVWYNY